PGPVGRASCLPEEGAAKRPAPRSPREGEATIRRGAIMFRIQMFSTRSLLGLVALLTIALAPSTSRAQAVYFRNDSSTTVTIYASCVVRGIVMRANPAQLRQKKVSPPLNLAGPKLIATQAARSGGPLSQDTTPDSDDDRYFSIVPDQPAPRLKLQRASKFDTPGPDRMPSP